MADSICFDGPLDRRLSNHLHLAGVTILVGATRQGIPIGAEECGPD